MTGALLAVASPEPLVYALVPFVFLGVCSVVPSEPVARDERDRPTVADALVAGSQAVVLAVALLIGMLLWFAEAPCGLEAMIATFPGGALGGGDPVPRIGGTLFLGAFLLCLAWRSRTRPARLRARDRLALFVGGALAVLGPPLAVGLHELAHVPLWGGFIYVIF